MSEKVLSTRFCGVKGLENCVFFLENFKMVAYRSQGPVICTIIMRKNAANTIAFTGRALFVMGLKAGLADSRHAPVSTSGGLGFGSSGRSLLAVTVTKPEVWLGSDLKTSAQPPYSASPDPT
jgi:hypothetical protein